MPFLLLVLVSLVAWTPKAMAACSGSALTWSCGAGSTVSQVNAALGSAADGATVTFAAGNYSWSSAITLNNDKGVTLMCASVGACAVAIGGTGSVIYMDTLSGTNPRLYRISGFRFHDAPSGAMPIWFYGDGTLTQLRIDHNYFEDFGPSTIAIMLGEVQATGAFYGVLDHNVVTASNNHMFVKVLGSGQPDAWPSSPKGTANNLFVEDNTITFTTLYNPGEGCMDIWNSAAIVWRHNSTTNCLVTSHGVVHGGGTINFELYDNALTRTQGSGVWTDGTRLFHHQGSGEFIAFNNVFTAVGTKTTDALAVTHYRSATPGEAGYSAALGHCNGSSARDGNRAPASTYYGYPCWRQPGRDGAAGLQPMYVWNNRWSDTGERVALEIENPWGQSNPSVQTHIANDRDYYNALSAAAQTSATSPFNGTTGMGFGTLARRPTTCTTNSNESGGGVGYFATDVGARGTLYRCSATNTWTVQYTPYAYPHPLQGGSPPAFDPPSAPTNLVVR